MNDLNKCQSEPGEQLKLMVTNRREWRLFGLFATTIVGITIITLILLTISSAQSIQQSRTKRDLQLIPSETFYRPVRETQLDSAGQTKTTTNKSTSGKVHLRRFTRQPASPRRQISSVLINSNQPPRARQSLSGRRNEARNQRIRSATPSDQQQVGSIAGAPARGPMALAQQSQKKCALILQRTYVRKVSANLQTASDSMDSDLEPNTVDSDQLQPTGKQERICITYEDVNEAIRQAKVVRGFTSVAEDQVASIEPRPPVIAELGELNQEVTKILSQRFDLSPDEILNGLPLIDMSRTDFWPICPLMVKPIRCDPTGRFRSFTGHCNNLKNAAWGAAQTPFVRYLAPRHPDGIQAERSSVVDGSPLPSPRLVTSTVHRDNDQPSGDLSLLIMVWGQIIDHDVALAAPPRGKFRSLHQIYFKKIQSFS